MSTALPLHRSPGAERVGWRAMAVDNDLPFAPARLISVLRLKPFRSVSRPGLVVVVGAFFCLWFISTQFGSPPFLSSPFPPPPPPPHGFGPPSFGDDDLLEPGMKLSPEGRAVRAEEVKE